MRNTPVPHTAGYLDALMKAGIEFHTEPFDHAVTLADTTTTIANNATAIGSINITQEADLVIEKWVAHVLPANSLFSLQLRDEGTQRVLSNEAILSPNIVGTAQRPRLWKPRVFRRNTTLTLTVVNLSGGQINRLQIVGMGYKIFSKNALNLNQPLG